MKAARFKSGARLHPFGMNSVGTLTHLGRDLYSVQYDHDKGTNIAYALHADEILQIGEVR